jgi:4-hydroxybenzoate polyprenyltransferase
MNIAYCVWLKHKPIIDVFIIAVGFVLRIFVGGVATGIALTHWLVLMTFLLALFLAFSKRRDDVVMFETQGKVSRKNVVRYNLDFMNQVIGIIASITMVCYIMYTVSPEVIERFHTSRLYLTSVFVLAGIIRYLQVTIVDVKSGSPTKVLMHDKFIQICVVAWVLSFILIIYYLK